MNETEKVENSQSKLRKFTIDFSVVSPVIRALNSFLILKP